ncbi:MAG: Rrf2 family transcriptional regulator [Candidatus Omnitrophica bacterium]|nr:Rrf2 family transcriptional regulator [Candidatus Omnitrophota bacterium]
MKLLTRETDYSVRVLCHMAAKGNKQWTAAELYLDLRIPRPFLRRILQMMNKGGLLESRKGRSGGFRLASAPRTIKLADVVRLFQGELRLNECLFKKRICPDRKHCPLRSKIQSIEDYAVKQFEGTTIQSLLQGN